MLPAPGIDLVIAGTWVVKSAHAWELTLSATQNKTKQILKKKLSILSAYIRFFFCLLSGTSLFV